MERVIWWIPGVGGPYVETTEPSFEESSFTIGLNQHSAFVPEPPPERALGKHILMLAFVLMIEIVAVVGLTAYSAVVV